MLKYKHMVALEEIEKDCIWKETLELSGYYDLSADRFKHFGYTCVNGIIN